MEIAIIPVTYEQRRVSYLRSNFTTIQLDLFFAKLSGNSSRHLPLEQEVEAAQHTKLLVRVKEEFSAIGKELERSPKWRGQRPGNPNVSTFDLHARIFPDV